MKRLMFLLPLAFLAGCAYHAPGYVTVDPGPGGTYGAYPYGGGYGSYGVYQEAPVVVYPYAVPAPGYGPGYAPGYGPGYGYPGRGWNRRHDGPGPRHRPSTRDHGARAQAPPPAVVPAPVRPGGDRRGRGAVVQGQGEEGGRIFHDPYGPHGRQPGHGGGGPTPPPGGIGPWEQP